MAISLELMPLEEKPPEPAPPKTIVVRFGYLKLIGEFPSDITSKIGCGTKVVIRTDRGTEIAEMLTTTCSNGGCTKSITREKMLAYIDASGGSDYPFSEAGRVLRVATVQDLAEQSKLDEQRQIHVNMARELVARHALDMKIVEVEYILGGERVMFYFTSEHRVDFRGLVRDLAHQLHTRIELRQVGARDEARITADYEKCGQHCCCKSFLKVLTPISMKAAKIQKATLDPAKISGRCGRLMCCLRYEDQTYEELRKKLPKRNTRVKTEKGEAWVVDGQILTQLVLVQYDDFKREAIPMEQIQAFDLPKPRLPDGRVMQSPNDRPPVQAEAPNARGSRNGPPGGPRSMGPRPQGNINRNAPQGQSQGPPVPLAPSVENPGNQDGTPPPTPDPVASSPNTVSPPSSPFTPPPAAPPMRGPRPQNQGPRPPRAPNFQQNQRGPMPPRQGGPNMPRGNQLPRGNQIPRQQGMPNPQQNQPPRPQPGNPANAPHGDPLATSGPTGGDLNAAPETGSPPNSQPDTPPPQTPPAP